MSGRYDVVVVGSGPNGLAAAIAMAEEGRSVLVIEGRNVPGGGASTGELTLPGYLHDTFSAVHPLGAASPFFRSLGLESKGLEWIHPPTLLAHPLDDGTAAALYQSLDETATALGRDADSYHGLLDRWVERWDTLAPEALAPLHLPSHPLLLGRFGLLGLQPASWLLRRRFETTAARALLGGIAAHASTPLTKPPTGSYALILAAAGHASGWPFARGGSGRIAAALAAHLRSLGGEIELNREVNDLRELPPARSVFLDLTPRQILRIAGDRLAGRYSRALERYRYGCGVYKMDWALSGPIPWTAEACRTSGTVHVGGTFEEMDRAIGTAWSGGIPEQPFVILAQPSIFDPTRAPEGRQVAWGYCHVPNGSTVDMSDRIEAQIERFAPGFRDLVLARNRMPPAELERHNPNLVGGDIGGGSAELGQLFFRPAFQLRPHATPVEGLYVCSSSTPPGGGVHGMCGYHAARTALGDGY